MSTNYQKRNLILIGESGSGKTWLLNRLFGESEKFNEKKLTLIEQVNIREYKKENLEIKCFDIPGLQRGQVTSLIENDSQSQSPAKLSIECLNETIRLLRQDQFHQIFFVFKFGRMTLALRTYMKMLKRCLNNELEESTCTLVINQVYRNASNEQIEKFEKLIENEIFEFQFKYHLRVKTNEPVESLSQINFLSKTRLDEGLISENKLDFSEFLLNCSKEPFSNPNILTWSELKSIFIKNKHEFQKRLGELLGESEKEIQTIQTEIDSYSKVFIVDIIAKLISNGSKTIISWSLAIGGGAMALGMAVKTLGDGLKSVGDGIRTISDGVKSIVQGTREFRKRLDELKDFKKVMFTNNLNENMENEIDFTGLAYFFVGICLLVFILFTIYVGKHIHTLEKALKLKENDYKRLQTGQIYKILIEKIEKFSIELEKLEQMELYLNDSSIEIQ